jgi:hypothetical protein
LEVIMSILQIIAIAGVLLGAVSFVIEIRQKGKKSLGLFAALIIVSAALFVVAGTAQDKIEAKKQAQLAANEAEAPAADAAVANSAADAPAEDEFIELGEPIDLSNLAEDTAEAPAEAAAPADVAEAAAPADVAEAAAPAEVAEAAAPADVAEAAAPAEVAEAAAPAAPVEAVKLQDSEVSPKAVAGAPMDDAKLNEEIVFTSQKSQKHPKGANIVSCKWDFGDGTSADTCDAKHAYDKVGTYIATLTVIDADGHFGIDTRQIDVVRPAKRITFIEKKLPDLKDAKKSPDAIQGTYQKTFTGSKLYLEASGYILSAEGCDCEIIVNLNGPGCNTTKRKKLSDGGEGDLNVKAVCNGEVGEHTWTVDRKVSNGCTCTFTNVVFEGSES